ncbi:hypothetical protein U1Q18_001187 [Sarracenia purpurea var. burkii]
MNQRLLLIAPVYPMEDDASSPMSKFKQEGVTTLFSGVVATVLRQTLYSIRMGLYDIMNWSDLDSSNMPLARNMAAGLIVSGVVAVIGNPVCVAMVRRQADGQLPPTQQCDYEFSDLLKTLLHEPLIYRTKVARILIGL